MSSQCRSCLSVISLQYTPLLEPFGAAAEENLTHLEVFNMFTKLEASGDDGLPMVICDSCTNVLRIAYNFVKVARRAAHELHLHLHGKEYDYIEEEEVIEYEANYVQKQAVDGEEETSQEQKSQIVEIDYAICDDEQQITEVEYAANEHDEKLEVMTQYEYVEDEVVSDAATESVNTEYIDCNSAEELDQQYLLEYDDTAAAENMCKWECTICHRLLRGDVSHIGHMNLHKGLHPYQCDYCDLAFRCNEALQGHMQYAHATEDAHSIEELQEEQSTDEMQYVVTLQGDIDETKDMEKESIQIVAPGTQKTKRQRTGHNCVYCTEVFDSSALLEEHRATHVIDDRNKCQYCSDRFLSSINLRHHIQRVHPEHDIKLNAEQEYLDCSICHKQLLRRNMSRHMNSHHTSSGPFICSHCSLEFPTLLSLQTHKEEEHITDILPVQFKCNMCFKDFPKEAYLKRHISRVHRNTKYPCEICGNSYKLKSLLAAHVLLHSPDRPFKCTQCTKSYTRQADLNVHLRSHSGELPFMCHLCGKGFAIRSHLTYHMDKHLEKKYKCEMCSKLLTSRLKLTEHMFEHTGMPYICELCPNLATTRRVRFAQHMLRVHDIEMTKEQLAEIFAKNTGKSLVFKPLQIAKSKSDLNEYIH